MTAPDTPTEVRRALAEATPGPWELHYIAEDDADDRITLGIRSTDADVAEVVNDDLNGNPEADAHLIANAPTWLAQLCDEIDRLRTALEERNHYRFILEQIATHPDRDGTDLACYAMGAIGG